MSEQDIKALVKPSWLPASHESQEKTFNYLKKKIGQEISIPEFPKDGLIRWSVKRIQSASDEKATYRAIYENLLIAQRLLPNKGTVGDQTRRGMRLARYAGLVANTKIRDRSLLRLFMKDFFYHTLMPHQVRCGMTWDTKR